MELQKKPFTAIKCGRKNIELRLFDEKRQELRVNDYIAFTLSASQEQLRAKVKALHRAASFEELFHKVSLYDCGFDASADINSAVLNMRSYYTEAQEKKYGVLGIEFSEVYYQTKWLSDDDPVLKYIPDVKWKRMYNFDWDKMDFFTITTTSFIINITGGSVKFLDKKDDSPLKVIKGFNYLYTGDVNGNETELMALENGKHFYIFSLEDFSQKKKVTLKRGYESIDMCGRYSEDGKYLNIPVSKYVDEETGYDYRLCQYETENYNLLGLEPVTLEELRKNGMCWID